MQATETRPATADPAGYNFRNQANLLESMIAEIQQAIAERHAAEVSRDILARLEKTAENAFMREESLMQAVGYPNVDEHRKQHRDLLQQLASFIQRAPKSNGAIGFELKIFLKAWLAQHVNDTDRRFLAFISKMQDIKEAAEDQKSWWRLW